MDVLLQIQDFLVKQHLNASPQLVTKVALAFVGVRAVRGPRGNLATAAVRSFFLSAFAASLCLQVMLNGHRGPGVLFTASSLWENAFFIHMAVYLVAEYAPGAFARLQPLAPLLEAVVAIHTGACATAAMDANDNAGAPYALIAGFLVWHASSWMQGDTVTTEALARSALILLPYYAGDWLRPAGLAKGSFLLLLAYVSVGATLLEAYAGVSVGKGATRVLARLQPKPATRRAGSPTKSPRRSPAPKSPKARKDR